MKEIQGMKALTNKANKEDMQSEVETKSAFVLSSQIVKTNRRK